MTDIGVRFWGVRGSVACPGPATARYGGNTACVEVRCADRLVIFDGGTGLRLLGQTLVSAVEADLFFSHCHMDHIGGLPFFAPCYRPESRLNLWAGNLLPEHRLEAVLRRVMADPVFPTDLAALSAAIQFHDFHAGDVLQPGDGVTLQTAPLDHPGGAVGYRLEYRDRALAYITDTEHRPGSLDPNVLRLARGADLMIYDSNYTDDEFPGRVGRGHSTWQQGVRLADAAGAKVLAIFHHDPGHDDEFLDRLAADAASMRPGTVVAREGLTLRV